MIALLLLLMASYSLSPTPDNRFTLEVEKTGFMRGRKHTFTFPKYTGKLQYDASSATASKVEFTLDGASMTCEDTWVKDSDRQKILDWGLRKMIEVDKYPEIRFVSGKIDKSDSTHYQVYGALTMRGVSHPAVVAVTADGVIMDGNATVDMREWGMKPPSAGLGTVGTKPDLVVHFHLTFKLSR